MIEIYVTPTITDSMKIKPDTVIDASYLTIAGGATGFACVADVDVYYRAKVAGGYLA